MKPTVFISGASAGFGLAMAKRFAATHQLILAARRIERLVQLKHELKNSEVLALELDVRDKQAVSLAVQNLPPNFRAVDILINNAGLALGLDSADQAKLEDWEVMIDTNIKGLVFLTRLLLPGMVERNRGHIINIGSVAGHTPYPSGNVYGATKAFVDLFSRGLRSDLLGKSIKVTNIEPGLSETEFSLVRFKGDSERASRPYQNKRALKPEDIADIAYWVTTTPEHVNINAVEVMPICQAWGPFKTVEGL